MIISREENLSCMLFTGMGPSWDDTYTMDKSLVHNGLYGFVGYTGTLLEWEEENLQWMLTKGKAVSPLSNSRTYPLGKHYSQGMKPVWFSLSSCTLDEFNCDDGHCVPMTKRCNGKVECKDQSGKCAAQYNLISQKEHFVLYSYKTFLIVPLCR